MDRLINGIHEAMNERGITNPNYRIKIIDRQIIGNSDWAKVTINIFPPHKKKPTIAWNLAINFVRNIIDWDKSNFDWL